jgi:acetylornithine deacetylase
MSCSSIIVARIREALDASHALELLQKAISIPSVTGDEANFAEWLKGQLAVIGVEASSAEFADGRPNVWGVRQGRSGADTLLLIGHTDTVHTRGWKERWAGGDRESPFSGALADGAVWGRGASDLKAGLCMTLEAVRTLDRVGIEIDPTLLFAFVGDEESGEFGSGGSTGASAFSALIARGAAPRPDMAIYVEPTMLDVYVAHMGFFLCDIKVIGKSAYFGVPELGFDTLKGAHAVLEAIWRYSAELGAGEKHALVGSGFVLPTGIQGGGYIAVPGECTISMIAKIPPGVRLDDVRAGLEGAARAVSMDSRIELQFSYPAPRDHRIGGKPFESHIDEARLGRFISAIRAVRPERGNIEAAPYWSELPILSALGVPGVYFAPGDIRICHTAEENVSLQDYYDGIIALAPRFGREPIVANRFAGSKKSGARSGQGLKGRSPCFST